MEKPKAFIHHKQTTHHDFAGVFVVGKFVLPVSILMTVWGIIVTLLVVWGFIGSSLVDWQDGWSFMPALYAFGAIAVLWAVVGIISMFSWMAWTVRRANGRV